MSATRTLVQARNQTPESAGKPVRTAKPSKDADTTALERSLSDHLGLAVQVNHKGDGGQLRINYKSLDQLERICRLLEAAKPPHLNGLMDHRRFDCSVVDSNVCMATESSSAPFCRLDRIADCSRFSSLASAGAASGQGPARSPACA